MVVLDMVQLKHPFDGCARHGSTYFIKVYL